MIKRIMLSNVIGYNFEIREISYRESYSLTLGCFVVCLGTSSIENPTNSNSSESRESEFLLSETTKILL